MVTARKADVRKNAAAQRYQHNCLVGVAKDVQVPVCPLCNRPVPSKRGDPPDVAVSSHIDRECRSDPALAKRKAFTNRCSMKGCKQKELVPVLCGQCNLNHCLKHRHPDDHSCTGRGLSPSGAAAMARLQHRTTSSPAAQMMYRRTRATTQRPPASPQRPCTVDESCVGASVLQGNLTEDEALALALQQSLYEAEFPEDGVLMSAVSADARLGRLMHERADGSAVGPALRRLSRGAGGARVRQRHSLDLLHEARPGGTAGEDQHLACRKHVV
ncbi:hypothetical protein HPB47_001800 [Ixodes persulcatus]|uniref:Uncharacterized protein n=1 Tax=Ixodes persulcatus TaxID=34615 RepID=A0AC60PN15_IXOPE|nr:hypothetical protein HPB47_001800 [Ixodes persulcatus]